MYSLTTHESIRDFTEDEWNALAAGAPPFLTWAFLEALESTGCVVPERGWLPMHLSIREDHRLVAVAPAYVKGNSEGEFVFDHGWAQFSERLGAEYYPKLIVASPFTPATGPRLLAGREPAKTELIRAFVAGLHAVIDRCEFSSAHVLFPDTAQAEELSKAGCMHRYGIQYHWHNAGYRDFDDFLQRFNSKRRNQMRRELRELDAQGTVLESLTGVELTPEVVDFAFECYVATVNKYFWGRQYLNRHFFEQICSRLGDHVLVVLARDAASRRPVAGAFNLLAEQALFGRYWGAREERSCLHFNVCYYHGIRECIRRGLSLFEPGAGGEHKLSRGFEPAITHSVHVLKDVRISGAIDEFVARERAAVIRHLAEYEACPILKPLP